MWFSGLFGGSKRTDYTGLYEDAARLEYRADKAQSDVAKKLQDYRNKMVHIANGINQNTITTNTTLAIQQSARKAVALRKGELTRLGSSAVAAAAAGVKGRSVTATLLDIQRNAGLLEKQRTDDLSQTFLQLDQQRVSSALSAIQNQDLSYIATPRLSDYLFSAQTQAYITNSQLPEPPSLFDRIGGFAQTIDNTVNNFGVLKDSFKKLF